MKLFSKQSKIADVNKISKGINPEILEVNLVRDEVGVDFNWGKHLLSLFLTLLISAALVAEIYYGLDWWQKEEEDKTAIIKMEYEGTTSQIKNISNNAKDFSTFKNKLNLTKELADNHVYWSNFFNWLEKNTLNSVTYSDFSGDISGKYSLAATAKTFGDISWQAKAFKDSTWTDSVSIDSGSSGSSEASASSTPESTVSFTIDLQVKPHIFFRQAE